MDPGDTYSISSTKYWNKYDDNNIGIKCIMNI